MSEPDLGVPVNQGSNMPDNDPEKSDEESRENWNSRVAFWLAAIGSAVGLGNLWRFPWQCATWGGGPFIAAYLICLVTLGMPIMTQELTLGQKHRSGDIEAFGKMNPRLRGIGLTSVFGAFGIVTYYIVIIGMSLVLFFDSFKKDLPYGDPENPEYAFDSIWYMADSITSSKGIIGGRLYLATMLSWVIVYICIQKGVKSASWAVMITMPLPIIFLIILLIHGMLLPGAVEGITSQYLNFGNWDNFTDIRMWNAAIGQCFFSLGVCMGVMTAYASYNPKNQNIAKDEKVISLTDLFVSLLSGFVVYSVLGHLVYQTGDDSYYTSASFGLVFVVYPLAIASFKGANFFGLIFFLCLFLLGIDSAFSLVEAVATVICDSDLNKYKLGNMSRSKVSAILCFIGAFISSVYCFDTGLYWLDIIDRYINNYGMVFLGAAETFGCGWFYRLDLQFKKVGVRSVIYYRWGYIFSVATGCILGFGLSQGVKEGELGKYQFELLLGGYSWLLALLISLAIYIIFFIYAYKVRINKDLSFGETIWYIAGWPNIELLRSYINTLSDENWPKIEKTCAGQCRGIWHINLIGPWWGFLIKYFIPTILTLNLLGVMRTDTWNGYEGYPWGYLTVGILIFSSMVIGLVVVAIRPDLMTQKDDEKIFGKGYVKTEKGDDDDDDGVEVELAENQ